MATLEPSLLRADMMLHRYISLNSQQNRLRQEATRRRTSLSPDSSPMQHATEMSSSHSEASSASASPTFGAQQHFSQLSSSPISALPSHQQHPQRRSPRSPTSIPTIPEDDSLEEFEIRDADVSSQARLADVNNEIKTTLMGLLNSESVRKDGEMRLWIQTRLMDAEMELKRQRRSSTRRRSSTPKIILTPTREAEGYRRSV